MAKDMNKSEPPRGAGHLGFVLDEGEGFNRDRVSVFLLLNLVVQSYAEHQMAGFETDRQNLGLAAFLREVTGLFQGRFPEILKGYGPQDGWSGEPFNGWLRARLAEELTEQERHCFAWKDDSYLVALAVSKMATELHELFAEQLRTLKSPREARAIGSKILSFCARWSLVLSGDDKPLPDFSQDDTSSIPKGEYPS